MVPWLLALACSANPPADAAQPPPPPAPPAAASTTPPADAPARVGDAPGPGTLLALGDLHADLDNALSAMKMLGVVDETGHWAAGQATFVQTGDLTDRGPDSGPLIDLMQRLIPEAEAAGGRVVALLGNHEVMNLQGDLRYVHPGDYDTYGGKQARAAALGPSGDDGRFLRGLDAVAVVDGVAFVHGGVHPEVARLGVATINDAVRTGIDASSEPPLGTDGPLWYRGYVEAPEPEACPLLAQALTSLGATRMVVGHTTRRNGKVESRCEGRLAVIDIGIADHYGAHLGGWRSDGGDARAVYPTGLVDLPDPDGALPGHRGPG